MSDKLHVVRPIVRASRYRQLRLTATLEGRGGFSYSVYAKGLNDAWNEHACLVRDRYEPPFPWPLLSTDDVVAALHGILGDQRLPGLDG